MTSKEYAHKAVGVLTFVVNGEWSPAAIALRDMLVQRIEDGAEEYEVEPGVQGIELKSAEELVNDIREEAVDQVAYAVALWVKFPAFSAEVYSLVSFALQSMAAAERLQQAIEAP